jgi:hypothetical protein
MPSLVRSYSALNARSAKWPLGRKLHAECQHVLDLARVELERRKA